MGEEYFLGLDMGTGSVGWAVTNLQYEIDRKHGKALWGVRLFESANTSKDRRTFRTARRRLSRCNQRVELLQEIFADEINQIDDGFFQRMKESRYLPEDKRDLSGKCPELPYALFVDKEYTDKDYHAQFPSIYHLRKWLMETDETPDIRLVYLALHHMMKHRGHFLFSGDIDTIKNFREIFGQLLDVIQNEEMDFHIDFTDEKSFKLEKILGNSELARVAKKTTIIKELGAKTSCEKAVFALLAGCKVKLSDIFSDEELKNSEQPNISFSDNNYEEYEGVLEVDLGERFIIIQMAKAVYDWSVLTDILGDYTSISEAKVAMYEKHKADLTYLKQLVRENMSKCEYREIFGVSDEKMANYSAYIGMAEKNGKKQQLVGKKCAKDEFYSFLKKNVIEKISDDNKTQYLKSEIEKGTFLPKQTTKDNGVIPYQIHLYEMNCIIENLKPRIPLLRDNEEKIRQIFAFRIPYYVGPLNGVKKGNEMTNWVVRNSDDKIYPWNFETVVDTQKSAERFIRRMTNKCTCLPHEDVLPKNSMLYSRFMVLDELNNLRLDGEEISVDLKQKIYEDVFCRYRKVTQKKLKDYLVREGLTDRDVDITGIDGDFKSTLTAYHDFKEKLTGCNLSQAEKEEIILDITLFGEDKALLSKRLRTIFPQLTDGQIKALCSLSYKGWGRLSRRFLCDITVPAPNTGEEWNILTALWETNDNLMQILSEKYQFADAVEKYNKTDEEEMITYRMLEEFPTSPAVKRQIWQALQIVKEVCGVMGNPPKRIFIEMARGKTDSKRTVSRKKVLMDLYKSCRTDERDWIAEMEDIDEQKLRGDKLYLYYTQKGRCMYSGEIIDLDDLWDNNKYDIDHIYPQSKVMDDSLDNRVLVKKEYNAEKSDDYPIAAKVRQKMQPYWKMLLDGKFISAEKYKRLVRASEFEPSELAGFIARQLVETRQGTKAVASILKQVMPETEIVYARAKVTSKFRQDFGFIKVREMNDLHHAKDAYLNIVVGNTYYVKFTKNAAWYIKEHPGRSYNLQKMFTARDVERNGETAWRVGENGTIKTVRQVMNKNNILVTRRSYEAKGALFDQQLMKKGKGQVPIKGGDERLRQIEKYGGYNKATGTYFMLVESEDKKENKIRTIEYVPLYLKKQIETEHGAVEYLSERLKNPRVLLPKIKIDTLFKVDGFYMWLSGRTGNQLLFKCGVQLVLASDDVLTLKRVLKYVQRQKENRKLKLIKEDLIDEKMLVNLYDVFLSKTRDTIYKVRLGAQEKTLSEKREVFLALSNEEKCVVLSEILHLFQCQSGAANLKLIGGPASAGIIVLNNDITKCGQVSIINQSPTGIYENEIDLLKI